MSENIAPSWSNKFIAEALREHAVFDQNMRAVLDEAADRLEDHKTGRALYAYRSCFENERVWAQETEKGDFEIIHVDGRSSILPRSVFLDAFEPA